MKASEVIRALECMPGDADVYFEYSVKDEAGELTFESKRVDIVHGTTHFDIEGEFPEVLLMCDEEMTEVDEDGIVVDIVEAFRHEATR